MRFTLLNYISGPATVYPVRLIYMIHHNLVLSNGDLGSPSGAPVSATWARPPPPGCPASGPAWLQTATWARPTTLSRKSAPTGRPGFRQSTGLSSYRQASSPIMSPNKTEKDRFSPVLFCLTATWARTKDLLLRRQLLYPTELLPHAIKVYIPF